MKKLILGLVVMAGLWSCSEQEPDPYTGRQLEFELFKSSDYDFDGNLVVKELTDGNLELTLRMDGPTSNTDYSFPAHLHFGSYDQEDSPIAFILNPVSAKDLKSVTQLGQLSDGSRLTFEEMSQFDGHVKIHLANEGPDYKVILVAGNIGINPSAGFDAQKVAVCGKDF
ncbi:hypothetical protein Aoki45_02620 [Algoriphagus sp. oki45]|uniref:hypothetical protein n=1 Tax=Algoriphagus sp. oki45 TaxID=3067294 RepID=UPI0027ECB7EF|nr:hypothetical protein Aoki45_02620 [Algoriphagus sp. oki45]